MDTLWDKKLMNVQSASFTEISAIKSFDDVSKDSVQNTRIARLI